MKITNGDVSDFMQEKVNLPQDKVRAYRKQVNTLRAKLEGYIKDNPEFELIKMLHSGSVAKGTALRDLNDMDVALYVRPDEIESYEVNDILEYVRQALIKVYSGNMAADQFTLGTHCVRVSFRGSGLNVDIVPIIPNGKADDRGDILNRETGTWLETSVPLHLEFIRARKAAYPDYAGLVRLTKWWRNQQAFKFKSFLIELLWCNLVDNGGLPETKIDALASFLAYILRTKLNETIIFTDYYKKSAVDGAEELINIYDPVNPENNVGTLVTSHEKNQIIEQAQAAFDAISMANSAFTKGNAVEQWQRVFGPSFQP